MPPVPARPRIVFVNRFFWPDISATSQMLTDVAFALAGRGHDVHVVASRLAYGDTERRFPEREARDGVTVHRVATTGFGRHNLIGRAADYASFYATAMAKALSLLRNDDILVVKTDPPLMSIPMGWVAKMRGAQQVNWLQDVYPEVAAELGIAAFEGGAGRLLARIRDRSLRSSAMNVAIGHRMAQRLERAGVVRHRLATLANFVDEDAVRPVAPRDNALRREWGYRPDNFVVGYSGNLGRAHDFDTVLGAAEILQAEGGDSIRFLFVGGGAFLDYVRSQATSRDLRNIDLRPYQDRALLGQSLSVPDIHWLSLRPSLEGLIVPSKVYGILAAGRPAIFVGAPDGEVGSLLADSGTGWTVEPGKSADLADLIRQLDRDRVMVKDRGRAARALVEREFSRRSAFDAWDSLVGRLGSPGEARNSR